MGFWDKLLGRNQQEAPKAKAETEYVTEESPEQVKARADANFKEAVESVARHMFNKSMIKGEMGRKEKMAIATERANEAVNLLSAEQRELIETVDESELRGTLDLLIPDAVEAYNTRQEDIILSEQEAADVEEAGEEAGEKDAEAAEVAKEDAAKEAA